MLGRVEEVAGEFVVNSPLDAERPVRRKQVGYAECQIERRGPFDGTVKVPFALMLARDVRCDNQPIFEEVLLQDDAPLELARQRAEFGLDIECQSERISNR